jgi:excisionase family DNA binding protein
MTRTRRPTLIARADHYATGEIATLLGVTQRTIARWVDQKLIRGFKLPNRRTRRILHLSFVNFVRKNPEYAYALAKIKGLTSAELEILDAARDNDPDA